MKLYYIILIGERTYRYFEGTRILINLIFKGFLTSTESNLQSFPLVVRLILV